MVVLHLFISLIECHAKHYKCLPLKFLFGTYHALSHLKVFGCVCCPYLKPYNTTKLQPKTTQCVFIGYAGQYKGYLCWSPNSGKIAVSKHVVFDEYTFPYATIVTKSIASHPPASHIYASITSPTINLQNTVTLPQSLSLPLPTRASDPLPTYASEYFNSSTPSATEFSTSIPSSA